jgi:hypothetical protein
MASQTGIVFHAAEGVAKRTLPRQDFGRLSVLLLCAVAVLLTSVEFVVRIGLNRSSRIEGRIDREHRALLGVMSQSGPATKVLTMGNSLLNAGVDFPAFQSAMGSQFTAARYVVEQTNYLDWYYGLRRLYSEGVRPDVVVLPLSARQMITDGVRGEYFAYRMMNASDFLDAARDAKLSATATVSLLLGRLSAFYGTRSETRKFVLMRVVPSVTNLAPYMTPGRDPNPLDHDHTVSVAGRRLKRMDEAVREHGGRFIFVVPASLDPNEENFLQEAGRAAGVIVLVPLPAATLSSKDFSDGFHLNLTGASRFTAALALALRNATAAGPQ